MRTVPEENADAWERLSDAVTCDPQPDHGAPERSVFAAHECRVSEPLSRVPTGKLRSALIATTVHLLRSGGAPPLATAASVKRATRMDLLMLVRDLIDRSEDESQMIGIAIEFSLQ